MNNFSRQSLVSSIVRVFIYNRPLSILVVLAIVLVGFGAFLLTPKQYNPEIERPAFQVVVEYPGAHVEEVHRFVTTELVEKISEIEGVDEVTAQSFHGGKSIATVLFYVGEDLEQSKVKLFTKMEENLDLRQGTIQKPTIKSIDPDSVPIVSIVFTSDVLQQNDVRSRAVMIMNELKQVPNVANLEIHGGEPHALSITLDQQAMKERGVTVLDITHAIRSSNVTTPHSPLTDGTNVIDLETDGAIRNVSDAQKILVAPNVRLRDVAYIREGYTEKNSFTTFISKDSIVPEDAVYLSIAKQEGSNAPTVSEDIKKRLSTIMSEQVFDDISYTIVRDDGLVASEEITGLGINLLVSIVIVGGVLFIFLSFRPAMVVMTAIPLTLLLVFLTGYFFDQSINRITLFALILSLGLLVDSATVVVENIYRNIKEKNDDHREIIATSVHQVGMGLFLSTITSVVVFIPMRFITGMMGPYMGPVAFFVPVALVMALVVSFVVIPFLSYLMIKPDQQTGKKEKRTHKMFDHLVDYYGRIQRNLLYDRKKQNRLLIVVGVLLVFVLLFPFLRFVHFQMLPRADKEEYYVYLDMPNGTGVVQTNDISNKIAQIIRDDEHTETVQLFVGESPIINFSGLFRGAHMRDGDHQATLKVNISPSTDRWKRSSEIVSHLRDRIKHASVIPDQATLRFVEIPPGPPVKATFVADIKGGTPEGREQTVQELESIFRGIEGVVDIDTSVPNAYQRIVYSVDTEKANKYGLTTQMISETLDVITGPTIVSQYHTLDVSEFAPIEVSTERSERDSPSDLALVHIESPNGVLIPLSSVTVKESSRNIPIVYTDGHDQIVSITSEVDGRSIVYIVIDAIGELFSYAEKTGGDISSWDLYGMEYTAPNGDVYTIDWGGEWEMTLDNFRDLGIAMLVAFFTVYIILVAQYRSFAIPALIMVTVPFGLVGILPGFALLDVVSDVPLTATALIGFIALIGIVVNNAIIYLEYIEQIKKEGTITDDREALIEAGKVRLRPILLTSLTTVLATLTIAFDPVWSGLAWSIVFGLSLSVFMTLGIFPVLYSRFIK